MQQLIANIGVNWWSKGDKKQRGLDLIKAAHDSGAHGICVPYLRADRIFRAQQLIDGTKKFDMQPEMLYDFMEYANSLKMGFIVAPRHVAAVSYLEQIGIDGYHISNGDINFTPLLEVVAATEKPVYLSTGMATIEEVSNAIEILLGDKLPSDADLIILHSTGGMPTPAQDTQLQRILDLGSEFFPLYIGYESFSANQLLDFIAMAYRPAVIMRRIDLDDRKGVETEYSLTPAQFNELAKVANAMQLVNNPVYYHESFTESDFDARIKQMRCAETEYLLPPDN
jgi:sialic acid synthase SpsE